MESSRRYHFHRMAEQRSVLKNNKNTLLPRFTSRPKQAYHSLQHVFRFYCEDVRLEDQI